MLLGKVVYFSVDFFQLSKVLFLNFAFFSWNPSPTPVFWLSFKSTLLFLLLTVQYRHNYVSLFNSSWASHFPRLCVHMILLCTELSLPAHFVKSLFSLRWLASLISQGQLVSWTAGARRTPVPLCVCSLDTLTLFNPPSPPIRLPPVPSTPAAVLLSFYLLSPGTHITRLTSNSKASPQDGPSGTSSLCPHTLTHTQKAQFPRYLWDSRWQTPRHKPNTRSTSFPPPPRDTHAHILKHGSSCGVWQGALVMVEGELGSTGRSWVNQNEREGGAEALAVSSNKRQRLPDECTLRPLIHSAPPLPFA